MTDTEKRIKIAEKCGWTFEHVPNGPYTNEGYIVRLNGQQKQFIYKSATTDEREYGLSLDAAGVPYYLSDLNAMHEVEKVLKVQGMCVWNCYQDNLHIAVLGETAQVDGSYKEVGEVIHATAQQRADAFLQTIGEEL